MSCFITIIASVLRKINGLAQDYLSAVSDFSEEGRRIAEWKSRTRDEKYWQQLVERSTT